ncbi:glycosyl transferase family 2 [Mesorhizobium sp. Root157]|uniref:glycosyl transferase family 2 n=1 Tax=Mesorhizobium sp. Root157 TaxID=1736477 RepID=UPI0007017888|nr:glycosyl transferase family 2 [Mesorhizobium sp. Root157]KQZ93893.1 glycosyl transferase family 2 [Mesorhizobium sp. Root157]
MLSVLIETRNDEEGLARTLASLIGGAVEGVVRDVIVCDHGSTDQTHKVADHAGCVWLPGIGLATAIHQAKGEWLLFVQPGARLLDGWVDGATGHMAKATMAARFARARSSRTPFFSRMLTRPSPLAQGLLISKARALALSKAAANSEALARGLGVKTLSAEIAPAPLK